MSKTGRLNSRNIKDIFRYRKAGVEEFFKFFSVLVPLVEIDGELFLLYEVRAKNMTRQPGEICFPGGQMEDGESPVECALRETHEEIGILPEDVEVIAQLDTIYTYSNFAMHCFLGIVKEEAFENMALNPAEVDEVFLISVDRLIEEDPEVYTVKVRPHVPEGFPYDKVTGGQRYKWRSGKAPVPIYDVDGRVIWGLTARITKRFVDDIKDGAGCLR
ncbi:MAG: CoA pyrophosphatase [Clostridiales bacterium]|nr:CoA pyrophosphatase [Clostridiales bacterium]